MSTSVTRDNRSITADPSRCAGCINCMLRCSFRTSNKFNMAKSHILIARLVGRPNEFDIDFTDDCDACLVCARYCPYGALTAKKTGDSS